MKFQKFEFYIIALITLNSDKRSAFRGRHRSPFKNSLNFG
jgi:hypothetical protein